MNETPSVDETMSKEIWSGLGIKLKIRTLGQNKEAPVLKELVSASCHSIFGIIHVPRTSDKGEHS